MGGSRKSLFLGFSQPNRSWGGGGHKIYGRKPGACGTGSGLTIELFSLPEPEDIEREFRARSRMPSRSPKVWADAYMLAFTAVAGLKLITFDRALKSRGNGRARCYRTAKRMRLCTARMSS